MNTAIYDSRFIFGLTNSLTMCRDTPNSLAVLRIIEILVVPDPPGDGHGNKN